MSRQSLRAARFRGRQDFLYLRQSGARQFSTSEWHLAEADGNGNGDGNRRGNSNNGGARSLGNRPGIPNSGTPGFRNANPGFNGNRSPPNRDNENAGFGNRTASLNRPSSFPPRPSGLQRSQTAAGEFGSMLNNGPSGFNRPPATRGAGPNSGEAPKVFDIRSLGGRGGLGLGRGGLRGRGGGGPGLGLGRGALAGSMTGIQPTTYTQEPTTGPPTGFPERRPMGPGGFPDRRPMGPGGFPDRRPMGPPGGFPDRRPMGPPGGFPDRRPMGPGGMMGRGGMGRGGMGRGGMGRGGMGRGGMGRGGLREGAPRERQRSGAGRDEDDDDNTVLGEWKRNRRGLDLHDKPVTPDEHEYIERRERGVAESYNPSLELEDLLVHAPPLATDSNPYGKFATAIKNLRLIGGSRPYDIEGSFAPRELSKLVKRENMVFLTDPAKRDELHDYVETQRNEAAASKGQDRRNLTPFVLGTAETAVREAISRNSIRGEHEAPQWASIEDPAKVARALHLKSETYLPPDVEKFQAKLNEVLSKSGVRRRPQPQPTA